MRFYVVEDLTKGVSKHFFDKREALKYSVSQGIPLKVVSCNSPDKVNDMIQKVLLDTDTDAVLNKLWERWKEENDKW